MSDEEDYEYEYDDDDEEMQDDQFEYTDDEEEADDAEVALENAYYNSKGLRETNVDEAADSFEQVIVQEQEELQKNNSNKKYGNWSYKAIKQLVKLHLRGGKHEQMMKQYDRLLECIAEGDVSPSAVEKGINGMLDRVSSLYQGQGSQQQQQQQQQQSSSSASENNDTNPQKMALAVYDATLKVFHPQSGACPNERLWFKTNLKYGQLLYEMNETPKLQHVLKDLMSIRKDCGSGTSTQSMEIYALQIQLYSRQKDNKKLREVFNKAMAVRGGIPHPRTLAMIQELGGKMHMAAREYEAAGKTFFQAFKSYDEAGDPSRLRCLKYLVLASMLHASSINPFDSQEARPYRDDPEIVAMTNLVQAFHANEIQTFERILRQNQGRIMEDEFVREHVEDLLRTIRTQVLRRVIRPYTRISLAAIASELNDIPVADVESLLVGLILDGSLDGKIDQVTGVLLKKGERGTGKQQQQQKAQVAANTEKSLEEQKVEAMNSLIQTLDELASSLTNARIKEGPQMRGVVH
ncbi:signalosome complex subunit 2 [Seminavis robusta]|uniref:Signalosome complex subunit 2 n=1 Tax=Seminavis robusta TaxID=568900 RepID=A0A9N8H812_9STRA|nr:signalosome complex subunit 2 [Seminavis robusta]|eukprot:Sro80_g043220.1 signalosome complex subunit 2 (521) ;mRNA; f:89011-90781